MYGLSPKRKRSRRKHLLFLESLVVVLAVILTLTFLDEAPETPEKNNVKRLNAPSGGSAESADALAAIDVELARSLAGQKVAAENYPAAFALYDLILTAHPENAQAWMERGITYARSGEHEGALEDYSVAIELAQHKALAYYNRGISYDALGLLEAAISDFGAALALDGSYGKAWHNRGYSYFKMGEWALAVDDLSKAIELDPQFAQAWNARGAAYAESGQFDKARRDYEQALSLDPQRADVFYNYGLMRYRAGDFQGALEAFSAIIASATKKTAEIWNNHGSVLHRLGQYQDAIASYSEALQLDPDHELARVNRAFAYRDLGLYADAAGDFSILLQGNPGHTDVYVLRGNVLEGVNAAAATAGADYRQFMTREGATRAGKRAIADHKHRQRIALGGNENQLFYVYVSPGDKLDFSVISVGAERVDPVMALSENGAPLAGNDDSDQSRNAALFDVGFVESGWVEVMISLSSSPGHRGELLFSVQPSD